MSCPCVTWWVKSGSFLHVLWLCCCCCFQSIIACIVLITLLALTTYITLTLHFVHYKWDILLFDERGHWCTEMNWMGFVSMETLTPGRTDHQFSKTIPDEWVTLVLFVKDCERANDGGETLTLHLIYIPLRLHILFPSPYHPSFSFTRVSPPPPPHSVFTNFISLYQLLFFLHVLHTAYSALSLSLSPVSPLFPATDIHSFHIHHAHFALFYCSFFPLLVSCFCERRCATSLHPDRPLISAQLQLYHTFILTLFFFFNSVH